MKISLSTEKKRSGQETRVFFKKSFSLKNKTKKCAGFKHYLCAFQYFNVCTSEPKDIHMRVVGQRRYIHQVRQRKLICSGRRENRCHYTPNGVVLFTRLFFDTTHFNTER